MSNATGQSQLHRSYFPQRMCAQFRKRALTNGTIHLKWEQKDSYGREYWLQQRFPTSFGGILTVLKCQWNWNGIAQGCIGSSNLLFRRVGYAFPWILVTSDNPKWDGLKFHYSEGDEGTLHAKDGRCFTRHWRNLSTGEREWCDANQQPILQAAWLNDVVPCKTRGLALQQIARVDYLQAAIGSTDLHNLLLIAMLDYFLLRVEPEE